jgi:hypothetical protein
MHTPWLLVAHHIKYFDTQENIDKCLFKKRRLKKEKRKEIELELEIEKKKKEISFPPLGWADSGLILLSLPRAHLPARSPARPSSRALTRATPLSAWPHSSAHPPPLDHPLSDRRAPPVSSLPSLVICYRHDHRRPPLALSPRH